MLTSSSKAYSWYNDDIKNINKYSALYKWAVVMNGANSSVLIPSLVQGANISIMLKHLVNNKVTNS